MATTAFSDSETTGDDEEVHHLSHDEQWLKMLVEELETYMCDAPPLISNKWRMLNTLTMAFHNGLRDTQIELENEAKKVFEANEALKRVQLQLVQMNEKVQALEAERDALTALKEQIQDMVMCQLDQWELLPL